MVESWHPFSLRMSDVSKSPHQSWQIRAMVYACSTKASYLFGACKTPYGQMTICANQMTFYNEITRKPYQHTWFNMTWFQPILTQIKSITAVICPFNWQAGIVLTQQLRGKQTNPICWSPHVSHHDCACSSRTKWSFKFRGILRGDLTTPSHHKPSPISV